MRFKISYAIIHAAAIALALPSTVPGQTPDSIEQITPLLTKETIAVVRVDLKKADFRGVVKYLDEVFPGVFKSVNAFESTPRDGLLDLEHRRRQLLELGCNEFYLVASLSDVIETAPLFVVPNRSGINRERLLRLLMTGDTDKQVPRYNNSRKYEVRPLFESLLVGAYNDQLRQLEKIPSAVRNDITSSFGGNESVTVVVSASSDQTRALSETSIPFPGPWDQLELAKLGSALKTISLAANISDQPKLQLTFKIDSEPNAKLVASKYSQLISILLPMAQKGVPDIAHLLKRITRRQSGDSFMLSIDGTKPEFREVTRTVLMEPLLAFRAAAKKNGRRNKMRQTILAIINFDSANGHLPPAASYSDTGKPLLSWRVAILPYLGQVDLYKQFRLDEPWDSEHNRKLVGRIPDAYTMSRKLADAGRTTFVVPTGEGTIFDRREGTKIKEIRDGLSKTVALVEVSPRNSVIWTKPADWNVDLENPLEGVQRSDRNYFNAVQCDGSVQEYRLDIDADKWKSLLTRDGAEVIQN